MSTLPTIICILLVCNLAGISGVLLPPDIPQNAVIVRGETTNLMCQSNTTDGVSWTYGGTPFRPTTTCGSNCATVPVYSTGAGYYSCGDADRAYGGKHAVATLTVLDSDISCGPQKYPVIEGDTVIMVCKMTYTITEASAPLKPTNVDKQTLSWDKAGITLAEKQEQVKVDLQTNFSLSVVAAKQTIPSYNCTANFVFKPVSHVTRIHADNNVSRFCASEPITVWYCPTTVIIEPSSGSYTVGSVLTCKSDGYPEPTFEWTGTLNVTGPTLTLPSTERAFTLTCIATGNITTPCQAQKTISGRTGLLETQPSTDGRSSTAAASRRPVTPLTEKSNLQNIIIIAAAVGGGLLLILIIVVSVGVVCCYKKRKHRTLPRESEGYATIDLTPTYSEIESVEETSTGYEILGQRGTEHSYEGFPPTAPDPRPIPRRTADDRDSYIETAVEYIRVIE